MLTALEIAAKLGGLPGTVGIQVLAELAEDRVYEAERLVLAQYGPARGDEALELIASLVRGTVRRES